MESDGVVADKPLEQSPEPAVGICVNCSFIDVNVSVLMCVCDVAAYRPTLVSMDSIVDNAFAASNVIC